jgi:AraC-like DNA-binding protein
MAGEGRAKLTMWEGASLWVLEAEGGLGDMDAHAHHAIQLTCLLSGRQTLAWDGGAHSEPIVAVDADTPHRLDLQGCCALLFVDPESAAGRATRARLFVGGPVAAVDPEPVAGEIQAIASAFAEAAPAGRYHEIGRAMVRTLAAAAPAAAPLPDPRIAKILSELDRRLDGPVSLADCAEGIYLSGSRLRHLFAEETGLPFKSYLLWRRLGRAVELYAGGAASLTEAAHQAGFADSAHFSRTFRRTFGLPATSLTRT